MAKETESPKQQVLLVDFAAQQRQQFLADMDEYRKNPIDRAKRRGGYFLNADGSGAHDAHGNPVKVRDEDAEHVEDRKRAAQFNRAASGLGQESADVETTSLADAMQGNISRSSFTAADTNVRVAADQAESIEPQSTEDIAAEIDRRHAELEERTGADEDDRLQTAEEARAEAAGEAPPKRKRSRRS